MILSYIRKSWPWEKSTRNDRVISHKSVSSIVWHESCESQNILVWEHHKHRSVFAPHVGTQWINTKNVHPAMFLTPPSTVIPPTYSEKISQTDLHTCLEEEFQAFGLTRYIGPGWTKLHQQIITHPAPSKYGLHTKDWSKDCLIYLCSSSHKQWYYTMVCTPVSWKKDDFENMILSKDQHIWEPRNFLSPCFPISGILNNLKLMDLDSRHLVPYLHVYLFQGWFFRESLHIPLIISNDKDNKVNEV